MRILMTVHHWLDPQAGVSAATMNLADAYRARGHDVAIVSWEDLPRRLGPRADEFWWYAWLAGHLARRVPDERIDVVDSAGADAVAWAQVRRRRAPDALLVARSHGLLHLYHEARDRERALGHDHTTWLNRRHEALDRALLVRTMRASDLSLFLNPGDRDYAVERLGLAPSQARVAPNGAPDELLGGPKPAPRPGRPARIAWIGGYDFRKGTAYAEAALGALLREHPDVDAVFLGVHRSVAEITARYPDEVARRVKVLPRFERPELGRLLREADILLMPSVAEGFGLAAVEAMACGVAPVVTSVGALPQIVRHEHEGLVVPRRDAEALRNALERLVSDRDELDRMRANAYERAQEFTWGRAADANLAAYEEALRNR